MKHKHLHRQTSCLAIAFLSCLTFVFGGNKTSYANSADILYISDIGDNTVKTFDENGQYLGTVVKGGGLKAPMGLIVNDSSLIVVNQNSASSQPTASNPKPGEIFSYAVTTGKFQGALISNQNTNAPFAPRGIVLKNINNDPLLFVADFQGQNAPGDKCLPNSPPSNCPNGRVVAYRYTDGALVGQLTSSLPDLNGQFHPRGIVVGPDSYLYFAVRNLPNNCGGSVLKSRLDFTDVRIVVTNSVDCEQNVNDLHRPEGLVFSPDGTNIYVTSFRKDTNDTDKILIFNANTGNKVGQILLDAVGETRAFAQAILFGPDGKLYVPIQNTGEVRRCDVSDINNLTCSRFIAPGILTNPNYLTFGKTDPATLQYKP